MLPPTRSYLSFARESGSEAHFFCPCICISFRTRSGCLAAKRYKRTDETNDKNSPSDSSMLWDSSDLLDSQVRACLLVHIIAVCVIAPPTFLFLPQSSKTGPLLWFTDNNWPDQSTPVDVGVSCLAWFVSPVVLL